MGVPETCYAKSGDVHIAYQAVGEGLLDLVLLNGAASNVELVWELPEAAHFLTRLSSFSRLILFDKRGTGLSDRAVGTPSLEERMDDVRAVMDAIGSPRATLFGMSEGGPMSMLFAATYPERTHSLVLYSTFAVPARERFEERLERVEQDWGAGALLDRWAPSKAADEGFQRAWARYERQSASPAAMVALLRMNREIDVRHVLPTIRVPTLVLHRRDDGSQPIENGRYLAGCIPGAKFVELPGADHLPWVGDGDGIADEIEEFLTGSRSGAVEPDRVLATVMFTDIVDSTRRAAAIGDREWRRLLGSHDAAVREEITRFRGRAVKNLGDGFLATFDGPARGVRCAAAIAARVRRLGIEVRSGLHTGEIELTEDDVAGIAVHTAARVAELAESGDVLVSSTVRDLVAGSGLAFEDRGSHPLKGLPESLRLFRATV
jgi:pimeloyl-ACP methyl ester carboxylesterase